MLYLDALNAEAHSLKEGADRRYASVAVHLIGAAVDESTKPK